MKGLSQVAATRCGQGWQICIPDLQILGHLVQVRSGQVGELVRRRPWEFLRGTNDGRAVDKPLACMSAEGVKSFE